MKIVEVLFLFIKRIRIGEVHPSTKFTAIFGIQNHQVDFVLDFRFLNFAKKANLKAPLPIIEPLTKKFGEVYLFKKI